MSRVIRTESGTTLRRRLLSGIALALRAFGATAQPDESESLNLLGFVSLSLARLAASVDETAEAWERRSYWVKADRFRREWSWARRVQQGLDQALERRDLVRASKAGMELATALAGMNIKPVRSKAGLWEGAWEAWRASRPPG